MASNVLVTSCGEMFSVNCWKECRLVAGSLDNGLEDHEVISRA